MEDRLQPNRSHSALGSLTSAEFADQINNAKKGRVKLGPEKG
jgi:hypothetical protein